jgi:hypothetical protein
MKEKDIQRINELYNLDKSIGLTPEQKELGVALVNIGASTTSVGIYEEGKLLNLAIFPPIIQWNPLKPWCAKNFRLIEVST